MNFRPTNYSAVQRCAAFRKASLKRATTVVEGDGNEAVRLFGLMSAYYLVIGGLIYVALHLFPEVRNYLPVGGVEELINQPQQAGANGLTAVQAQPSSHVDSLGDSLFWLTTAIIGALLTALPVAWTYMAIRHDDEYDQSLISTIILPLIVTGIVVIVQNSLALAFSLAGIAGAVRFKNSLKSSGDALFILLSVGIGLSAGIGAIELAGVMSLAFNYGFLALWYSEFGERQGMKRYMSDFEVDPNCPPLPPAVPSAPSALAPAAPSAPSAPTPAE